MRDIKFRAYLKRDKKIVDVKSIHFGTRKIIVGFSKSKTNYGNYSVSFDDIELMQYTGLHDKNGVEIYEGNIVKVKNVDYHVGEVVYDVELAEYEIEIGRDSAFPISVCYGLCDELNIEVLGNIWENGDLLNDSK